MSDVTRDQILAKLSEFDAIGQEEFLKKYPKNEDSVTTWLVYADKLYPVKPIWFSAQIPYDGGVRAGQTRLNSRHAERQLKALGYFTHRGLRREDLEQYLKLRKKIEPSISPSYSAMDDINLSNSENDDPRYRELMSRAYRRDRTVRDHVILRARGRCEYRECVPFVSKNGLPYLEAHHVVSLAADGDDAISNVIALCASHHREAHSGENWAALNAEFLTILERLGCR